MYLTSMISSSDIAGSFPFIPDEGESEHSRGRALVEFLRNYTTVPRRGDGDRGIGTERVGRYQFE